MGVLVIFLGESFRSDDRVFVWQGSSKGGLFFGLRSASDSNDESISHPLIVSILFYIYK